MEKYIKIIDSTILSFERKYPKCAKFIKDEIPDIKNETLASIKRYQEDVEVLGNEKLIPILEAFLISATEFYNLGIDYLQPHNDNDYKSAADSILIGMLEIKWITFFLKEIKQTNSTTKDNTVFENLTDATVNEKATYQILELLAKADLIDNETNNFKDSANGHKGHFISTIILFFEKNYLKRKPTHLEYLNICKNSFKLEVSIGSIKNKTTRPPSSLNIPPFDLNS